MRVRTEDGRTTDAVDVRRPVGIEIEYEVLKPRYVLVPYYHFDNDEGICAFIASESDPTWHHRERPVRTFISTAWVPGNFLSEGTLGVGAAVSTMSPKTVHFYEREAIAFRVIDSFAGDAARGNFAGRIPGAGRPPLRWTTKFNPTNNSGGG